MTFEQARLVRETFQLLATTPSQTIGNLFYSRLFETLPEARPLFSRTALPEQSAKLVAMLSYIVGRLNNLDSIVEDITALARRHEHYGVKKHHYEHVGRALLWTLEQALAAAWTAEVREAWTACYTLLAETMIGATRWSFASIRPWEPSLLPFAPNH